MTQPPEERYQGEYIQLSNNIIQAKEKTSLLESKIEVLAVRHMDKNLKTKVKKDAEGSNYSVDYVELKATEIRQLTDRSGGSLYDDIFSASVALKNKYYVMLDRDAHKYVIQSLYGDISYADGIMTIEYNPETEYLFKDLKANYTRLSLPILFSFHTNGGFQLYKLLKSFAYNLPAIDTSVAQEDLPTYRISYSLAELRMTMGFVDLNQKEIKKEAERRHPDFEKMVEIERNPKYKRWSDFNTRVIKPGLVEINSMSDIFIKEIQTDSSGKGSKVSEVAFVIQHNRAYYVEHQSDSSLAHATVTKAANGAEVIEYDNLQDAKRRSVMEMLAEMEITEEDADLLLKDAEDDVERIRKAYDLCCMQEHVANFMGWMRTAIRKQYRDNVEVVKGSTKKARAQRELQEETFQLSTQERVWKRTQEKPEFHAFLDAIGLSLEALEAVYDSPKERVELYTDWKLGRL